MKLRSCFRHLILGAALSATATAQGDECTSATVVTPGTPVNFDTTTVTPSTESWICPSFGSNDVWFTFTSPVNYAASASTCGTASFDTLVEVYEGTCLSMVPVACSDDAPGCSGGTSNVEWTAAGGTQYWIRVGGFDPSESGTGSLLISAPMGGGGPSNDECAGAIALSFGFPESFDNSQATFSANAPTPSTACVVGAFSPLDLWYTFTPAVSEQMEISLFNTSFSTYIEVYAGGCGNLSSVVCSTDPCGMPGGIGTGVTFPGVAGTTYYARVAGFIDDMGTGEIVGGLALPLPNDGCTGALPVGPGATVFSNFLATNSGQPMSCGFGGSDNRDVWFAFTATEDCPVSVDLAGTLAASDCGFFDTAMTVWSGGCGSLTEIQCNDNNGSSLDSLVTFAATAGTTYYIQVAGVDGAVGDAGIMTITDGLGTLVCVGEPNSTGVGAEMKATGSAIVSSNNLTLNLKNLPAGETVLFLNSREMNLLPNPGGSAGNLCIASTMSGRHSGAIVNSSAAGTVTFPLNLTNIPHQLSLVAANAGETWFWQAWYRDVDSGGMPTSNFSGAVKIRFQ